MKKQQIALVISLIFPLTISGCSSNSSQVSPNQTQSSQTSEESTQNKITSIDDAITSESGSEFLSKVNAAKSDAFASDRAAFVYLINFCGSFDGNTSALTDPIDLVVAEYCTSDLYENLK